MELVISDDLLKGIDLTQDRAMLDFAIGLFIDRQITFGRAASIASISQTQFLQELGKRKIPVHYDEDDLKNDVVIGKTIP